MALVLCDIFRSNCDRTIIQNLTSQVSRIFKYVVDYLVLLGDTPFTSDCALINIIKSLFLDQAEGLQFTHESISRFAAYLSNESCMLDIFAKT